MADQPGVLDGAIPPEQNTVLFGHGRAEEFLATAYRTGRMHHAILIEGAEGIGKATLAFRFANHILSHPDPDTAPPAIADPDPESAVFRQIAGGASHNLIHLARPVDAKTGKAKTVITVDVVRKAARLFSQTSGTGNWRIVIIDPADDLNRNAANAILKILEEPPRRSLFLVLSHAPGKLLPTIRSRCMTLRLDPLSSGDLTSALAALPSPGLPANLDRAHLARLSQGSVARALMLANYGGIDLAEAFEALVIEDGVADRRAMHAIAETLAARDRDVAFEFFVSHLIDWIAARARKAAMVGEIESAARDASLTTRLTEMFNTAAAYNLDRKQTVLSALTVLFASDRP